MTRRSLLGSVLWITLVSLPLGVSGQEPTAADVPPASPNVGHSEPFPAQAATQDAPLTDVWAESLNDAKKQAEARKKKKAAKKKAAAGAFKPLFYDNDFRYLDDTPPANWQFADALKRNRCCKRIVWDLGGQYRTRSQYEQNMRGLGLTGVDDRFMLQRTRLYANVEFGKRVRVFAEAIDAVSTYENFAPRPIEENRSDMLNLFVDAQLWETRAGGTLSGRVGRQEMLYGGERTVSPLDWANTRLTFDGGKLMFRKDSWQLDGFWLRPLRRNVKQFDSPILDLQFYGLYSTYKGRENARYEAYWLAFDNDVTGVRADSLGGRYYNQYQDWLFEFWGNYQLGDNANNSSRAAGAWTLGLGRAFDLPWKPALWFYYDWASGNNLQGAGNGYFHFFPLAHKYLGFMDLYGRRNIETPNVRLTFQPTKKTKVLLWYYYLFLEDRNDTPYSVTMTPFFPGVTPGSADLGHEIDFMTTYAFAPRKKAIFGYSHFFSGKYYDTGGLPYSGNANFFYAGLQCDF